MFSHQKALLEYGMLALNFWNMISKGDGERLNEMLGVLFVHGKLMLKVCECAGYYRILKMYKSID